MFDRDFWRIISSFFEDLKGNSFSSNFAPLSSKSSLNSGEIFPYADIYFSYIQHAMCYKKIFLCQEFIVIDKNIIKTVNIC